MLENASEILYFLSVAKFPSIDTDNLFSLFFFKLFRVFAHLLVD